MNIHKQNHNAKTFLLFRHSPEFQPKANSHPREPRHFLLHNKRTELIILQGDILTIKVDAIVNG